MKSALPFNLLHIPLYGFSQNVEENREVSYNYVIQKACASINLDGNYVANYQEGHKTVGSINNHWPHFTNGAENQTEVKIMN